MNKLILPVGSTAKNISTKAAMRAEAAFREGWRLASTGAIKDRPILEACEIFQRRAIDEYLASNPLRFIANA